VSPRRNDDSADRPVLDFKPLRRSRRDVQDSSPVALTDLLIPTLARLGLKTRARYLQILGAWPGVVGEMVAEHTNPVALARGRLTVETDSPAMGHQLRLQRQTIVDGINQRLGDTVLLDIRFRLAAEKWQRQ
jgi:predicted nucleic acid-binding Zn ribbon protein